MSREFPQGVQLLCKSTVSFKVDGKGRIIHFKEGCRFWVCNTMTEQAASGCVKVARLTSKFGYAFPPDLVREHFVVEM